MAEYQYKRLKQVNIDSYSVPELFFNTQVITWPLYLSTIAFIFQFVYTSHLALINYFIEWKEKDNVLDSVGKSKLLLSWLIEDNFWYILAWYQFLDGKYIFATSFELTFYLIHYWFQSNTQAVKSICHKLIKSQFEKELQATQLILNPEDEKQK